MFENFSKINYYLNGQTLELTDIFKSIKVDTTNSPDINTTKNINFERPDQLSNNLYNDPKLFWVNLALNNIKNPFKEWARSNSTQLTQNSTDFDTKIFQFANNSNYLPTNSEYFNSNEIDSYSGVSLSGIQQDDIIIFETGAGPLELKTYGAGIVSALNSCGYPHFGQSDIPDNFLNRNNIIQISCGRNFTACLDDLGYIWAWGEDIGLESSGFNLNGRLYNSPSGGYKHIDTTHDKIIAVTSTGDFICFGNCANFTFTGQSDIKKSSWTSGQTFAGIGIKNDNTISIFGPIVSTNSTIQYFSDVSCADDYCLGAATGAANNVVVGFGSTGYFEQVGQNTFYSSRLADLHPIPVNNPLYPFTDNNYSIIKKNEQDVLEIKIKELEPFTSPDKNPEIFYRSDYNRVFSSHSFDFNLLLGFTDKNSYSKDGYILNNSKKLFKNSPITKILDSNLSYKIQATTGITYDYNYSLNYDKNLKPIRPGDLSFKTTNYLGITFIDTVFFSANQQAYHYFIDTNKYFNFELTPTFYSTYKNGSPKTPFNGPLDKDNKNYYDIQANTNPQYFFEDVKGISYSTIASDPAYHITIMKDESLVVERTKFADPKDYFFANNYGVDENLYQEYLNKFYTININGISAHTTSFGGGTYWNSLGKIKFISKCNTRSVYAITENQTSLYFTTNQYDFYKPGGAADAIRYYFGVDPGDDHPYLHYREALQPPAGFTFSYLESSTTGFWSVGIDINKNLIIFGLTSELNDIFGYTGGFVYIPGITVDDVSPGVSLLSYIKNGKINILGAPSDDIFEAYKKYLPGGTITNAVKILSPVFKPFYADIVGQTIDPTLFVLDNTNTLKLYGFTLGSFIPQGYDYKEFDPRYNSYSNSALTKVSQKYLAKGTEYTDIKDIIGNGFVCFGTRTDNSAFRAFGNLDTWVPALFQFGYDLSYLFGITSNNVTPTYFDITYPAHMIKDNPTGKHTASDNIGDLFFPTQFFGTLVTDLCIDGDYTINRGDVKWGFSRLYKSIYPEEGLRIAHFSGLGGNQYPGDQTDIWDDSYAKSLDLQYGIEIKQETVNSKYGFCAVYSPNSLLIYSPYKYFDWKGDWIFGISKTIIGDGFIILAHPNKHITFLYGTRVPHSNTTLQNFINFSASSIYPNSSLEGFWNESVGSYSYSNGNWYILPQQPQLPGAPLSGITVYPVKYWGVNNSQNELPQNLPYIADSLSCGGNHCSALVYTNDEDQQYYGLGNVVSWGLDVSNSGVLIPPVDLGVCASVKSGWDHSCAVDALGNIRCWGSNEYGQCDVPTSANGNIKNFELGKYFSVVQKTDGKLIAWGLGLTGTETVNNSFVVSPIHIEIE